MPLIPRVIRFGWRRLADAMDSCKFYPDRCLGHYRSVAIGDIVVYVHLLPWFPVIDVVLLLSGGLWVNLFHAIWDFCRDYDFELWWVFEGSVGSARLF
jgi:hypothetical protein